MQLYALADWSVVVVSFAAVSALVGVVLGRLFTLTHRVDSLEGWFGEVRWELLAREQADDMQMMRERMQDIEDALSRFEDPVRFGGGVDVHR
ncbi:hypothetical protein AWN90_00100 [Nocardia terpenica]|uniref:Uncharacterized protein n=2 Tax=Nocardia terpenica TaxID=455432 RepID=A0A164PWH6_9NOCA|nr:hypothetical protein AWN90_00100 [Nocardia terpenica]